MTNSDAQTIADRALAEIRARIRERGDKFSQEQIRLLVSVAQGIAMFPLLADGKGVFSPEVAERIGETSAALQRFAATLGES